MTASPPPIGLIIVGDEILSGKRSDQHLPKFIELLKARGLSLDWAEYVGDSPKRITARLKRAFASGDLVFSTGGIGATPDDHTRQCAAAALGVDLALHPQAAAFIHARMEKVFADKGEVYHADAPDNIHRLNMAMFPVGAEIIPNPYNNIAGFYCQGRNPGAVHFFPGFPVMAWPMMAWVLDTLYPQLHQQNHWVEKSVIVMGAMEATLTPLMLELEQQYPGIKVFSLPSVDHPTYGRHIELGVKGAPHEANLAYAALLTGLRRFDAQLGPELVQK